VPRQRIWKYTTLLRTHLFRMSATLKMASENRIGNMASGAEASSDPDACRPPRHAPRLAGPIVLDTNVPTYMHRPSGNKFSDHHSNAAGKHWRQRILATTAIKNIRSTNVRPRQAGHTSGKANCRTLGRHKGDSQVCIAAADKLGWR